jgi:thiamine biosynthesis lipoprotein
MGMPVTVEVRDEGAGLKVTDKVFDYFKSVDERFSTYKNLSEISQINRGEIKPENFSPEMKEVFLLSEETKKQTRGYFDIKKPDQIYDPSGLVKGWAIYKAAGLIKHQGFENFFIEAGGDIQAGVDGPLGKPWTVGIRNPFKSGEIVKILKITSQGVATSGTYFRGQHIYNPHKPEMPLTEVLSITVIGPNIYEADRFATAAFAMGKAGINFIESLPGFEGYMIDKTGLATKTSGFERYV